MLILRFLGLGMGLARLGDFGLLGSIRRRLWRLGLLLVRFGVGRGLRGWFVVGLGLGRLGGRGSKMTFCLLLKMGLDLGREGCIYTY